jgi:hypothetical protein
MRRNAGIHLLLSLAMLAGCSHTVLVSVPPRVDVKSYGTLGIVDFGSNSGPDVAARALRQLEEDVQAAQPGTRVIELGDRQALLAAVGSDRLDIAALKKIGEKYGVGAVFVGELAYSQPTMDVQVTDVAKLQGGVSGRLLETATGASVWTSSAWARRQLGSLSVSAAHGVTGGMGEANPREAMLPALVYELTRDFRPTSERRPAS